MVDFRKLAETHANVPDHELKQAGRAIGGPMGDTHTDYVKRVTAMIKSGEIDYHQPESILQKDVYAALPQEARSKVDLAMVNLVDLLRHITEFYLSDKTPDASPQLQTMIEHLWQMKDTIKNQYGDVFTL